MSSKNIAIHLPDGAVREVPAGTTPFDIANSISPRLAAASVVARITPLASAAGTTAGHDTDSAEAGMYAAEDSSATRLVDLATPLAEDARLELVTEKDPEALKVVRHSAAHVLATAVLELFPETKLGHGPATDSGFFYDFYREKPFTPDDLVAIEKKMAEVVARDEKFVREYEPREQALAEFDKDGDFMKTHFVTKFTLPGSEVSFYRNGKFVDFCRGPHVPSTGRVKAVKLTALAGAYCWATKRTRNYSAFMAPPSSRKKTWTPTSRASKKPPSATTASWASSLTCSASRNWPGPASSSGTPKARLSAR